MSRKRFFDPVETSRPYRHSIGRLFLHGRNYSDAHRCLDGAIKFLQWQKIHVTVECWNVVDGRLLGWYRMNAKGEITFWRDTTV